MLIVWDECGERDPAVYQHGDEKLDYISIRQALSGRTLDVIGCDCNGMARLEAAFEFSYTTRCLVASQGVMPRTGLNYAFLEQLCNNPSSSASEVADMILEHYKNKYSNGFHGADPIRMQHHTLSVLEPSLLGHHTFTEAFNKFIDTV